TEPESKAPSIILVRTGCIFQEYPPYSCAVHKLWCMCKNNREYKHLKAHLTPHTHTHPTTHTHTRRPPHLLCPPLTLIKGSVRPLHKRIPVVTYTAAGQNMLGRLRLRLTLRRDT